MIHLMARLLKVLNSESDPGQISIALCLSMIMGLTPIYSLHNMLILLLALTLRVNLTAFILGWPVFTGLGYLLDPLFDRVGHTILMLPSMRGLWTSLYNITLFRIEYFNNSIVFGSLFISLILCVPLFFLVNVLVRNYRQHILGWIQKIKIVQMVKASKIYLAYQALST
jgi:uncharacterized protein (TIGR03546 family)